ncbi:DUF222 domain-containing protein [Georgenia satyanarayanai]|uniref:HNH endonuclease n=1 Tax=Georgenia satyanarayanai TaxID=860221 RepID=UPI00203AA7E2|nr:HNH endonuclease [Georgenia satyanarayanai]MCM3659464.1 DUF222 domain-containing protein [Georgenia satyanarayanai]
MDLEGDGTEPERQPDAVASAPAEHLEEMLPGDWKPEAETPATPLPVPSAADERFGPTGSTSWPTDRLAELLPVEGALGDYLAPLPPGPRLGILLAAIDPAEVDEYSLVELAAAHKRMESYAAAQAAKVAAELAERPALNPDWPGTLRGRTRGECLAGHELAMRLKMSKIAATRMAASGRAFGNLLEATGEALERGLIDYPRAQVIFTTLDGLPPEVALAAQWEVIETAPGRTLRQLREDLEKAVISVDPEEADARHRAARQKRTVYHPRALPDGMASMTAVLPAADAIAVDLTLESAARAAKHAGDGRTIDQLRADAFSLMAYGALANGYIGVLSEQQLASSAATGADDSPAGVTDPSAAGGEVPARRAADPPSGSKGPRVPADEPAPGFEGPGLPADEPAPGFEGPGLPADGAATDCDEPPAPEPGAAKAEAVPDTKRAGRGKGTEVPYGAAPPVPGQRLPGGRLPAVRLGTIGGLPVEVRLNVPLAVALPGLNAPARNALERDPEPVAELEGYGPIAPEVARALAAGGQWRRIVSDPVTGQVLDVGRTRYEPPAAMADLVRERDRTCIEPSCSTPARHCQLDHIHEWQHGGETSVWNLGPQCTRVHAVKSQGGFTVARASDGTYAWTTMTGHGYLRRTDGTVIMMPRETAVGLRRIGKEMRRTGRSVPAEVVDAVLAEVAAGSAVTGGWTPPPLPQRSLPAWGDGAAGPAWGGDDEPPF